MSDDDGIIKRVRRRPSLLRDDDDDFLECKKVKVYDSDEKSSSSTSSGKRRSNVVKSEDDKIALPDPFPLPRNYKANVESALKAGKLTSETRSAFLSSVASAMYAYKKYPTRDDYNCVARTIVAKYPFMKALPPDPPYVSDEIYEDYIVFLYSLSSSKH